MRKRERFFVNRSHHRAYSSRSNSPSRSQNRSISSSVVVYSTEALHKSGTPVSVESIGVDVAGTTVTSNRGLLCCHSGASFLERHFPTRQATQKVTIPEAGRWWLPPESRFAINSFQCVVVQVQGTALGHSASNLGRAHFQYNSRTLRAFFLRKTYSIPVLFSIGGYGTAALSRTQQLTS